jgi:hypothetical protein
MKNTTSRWGIPFLAQNQTRKEFTVNEAFEKLDYLLGTGAISNEQYDIPEDPQDGDIYLAPQSNLNSWREILPEVAVDDIILYQGKWKFIKPKSGMLVWLASKNSLLVFNQNHWHQIVSANSGLSED